MSRSFYSAGNQQQHQQHLLSSTATSAIASQKLLSQFIFLQNRDVLTTKILFEKLNHNVDQIQSQNLKDFIVKNKNRDHNHQNTIVNEVTREDFNGIILDLIDVISRQFLVDPIRTNNNNSNENENDKQQEIDEAACAANDLSLLYNQIFAHEALIAGWWNATERSRWRGSSVAAALSSEAGSNIGPKLMFGVTMAVEL